jgi:SsrA-binding protein
MVSQDHMKVVNKKARFEYDILETIEAGVVLSGAEAKSARAGSVDFSNSHIKILGDSVQVINLHIFPYKHDNTEQTDPARSRKLLLHKNEILALANKAHQKGLTLIPVALYSKGPKVKIEIGLARGKKMYQKREAIKRADLDRDVERELRGSK